MQFPAREIHFRTRARAARNITSLEKERERESREIAMCDYTGERVGGTFVSVFFIRMSSFLWFTGLGRSVRENERGVIVPSAL